MKRGLAIMNNHRNKNFVDDECIRLIRNYLVRKHMRKLIELEVELELERVFGS